ncbi:hypothetical protein [Parasitella parasitica]|uniref:Uncharacterized protein n=1 Tax=Parasitella parasitica TaxID=35722 RepID=A0A0B7NP98_9FUNG|nr:hypothetical protein [Parasitella parasitica]
MTDTNNPGETWAIMASRHTKKRFLQHNKRNLKNQSAVALVGSVLHEDDDLKGQIWANKAVAIIQQTLTSGSLLFSFPEGLFANRVDAYVLMQKQFHLKWNFVLSVCMMTLPMALFKLKLNCWTLSMQQKLWWMVSSGHIRSKCPELTKSNGHMMRFCPEVDSKKPGYVKKQKLSHKATQAQGTTMNVLDAGSDDEMLPTYDMGSDDVVILPGLDKKNDPVAYNEGSACSKYASDTVAVNMVVDKPADMLRLSTLNTRTQEEVKALDAKLKAGTRLSGTTGGIKAGDKRTTTTRNTRRAQ